MVHSMNVLSPEVALYLYKSTMWPCMEHYCHVMSLLQRWSMEMIEELRKMTKGTLKGTLQERCYLKN